MTRRISIVSTPLQKFYLLLIAALSGFQLANAQAPAEERIKITGIVKDGKTGNVVASASITAITLMRREGAEPDSVTNISISDPEGKFIITAPRGIRTILQISAVGFGLEDLSANI